VWFAAEQEHSFLATSGGAFANLPANLIGNEQSEYELK
jgi:hypothetical protein